MCLLYILFQSESLSCQELYQHVSWVEKTSVLSGNISDKQTQCYDISKPPQHGRGGDGGEGRWGEATGRSVYPGASAVWSAENKIGFLLLVFCGGRMRGQSGKGGGLPLSVALMPMSAEGEACGGGRGGGHHAHFSLVAC